MKPTLLVLALSATLSLLHAPAQAQAVHGGQHLLDVGHAQLDTAIVFQHVAKTLQHASGVMAVVIASKVVSS